MARDGARRDHHDRRGTPPGAALPARDGGPEGLRPVQGRRVRDGAGEPRPDADRPRRLARGPDPRPPQQAQRPAGPSRRTRPGAAAAVRAEPLRRGRAPRLAGAAPGDHLRVQPGRLRRRRDPVPEREPQADQPRGARGDPPVRGEPLPPHPRRGPARPRLPRLPRGADPRRRGPPRRDAADLQGVRRGAVHPRPVPGRVRHGDARPGHQHAGPLRRDREAVEVERRDARRHHAGGVHPADRSRRPPRHRRRGPRRGALAAGVRPQGGGRPRLDAHLPAQVVVPSVVQHGRQPRAPGRPGHRTRAAGVVVRPVPGGQGGRRARATAAQGRDGAGGVRRGGHLPPRRLHGVLPPAPSALGRRDRPGQEQAVRQPRPGGRVAGGAPPR